MANAFTIQGSATLNTRPAERRLQRFIKKAEGAQLNLKINERAFTQPLGRITGEVSEFNKSLKASILAGENVEKVTEQEPWLLNPHCLEYEKTFYPFILISKKRYTGDKYELSIEDTGSSSFSITDAHIIADAGITVDYGNKDKKANKVIVEFFNANKKYELDTATVLHTATTDASDYTSDDGGEVLEIKAEFPFITDPYIAYNMGKAILTRSRNQITMQFLGTPEMYKLNVGDIVDLTYAGLGFSGKVCRVEALELQPDGLVAVSLIEYFDVYTWQVPAQEPTEELSNLPSAYAVKAPTGLAFTDNDSS